MNDSKRSSLLASGWDLGGLPFANSVKVFLLFQLLLSGIAYGDADLARAALARTDFTVVYDGSYRSIPYPGGDVPSDIGVCSDVIVRAYRTLGVDLQQLVHEDMKSNFARYPNHWGLLKPDPNIDHRRVPNLETFFARKGTTLVPSRDPDEYLPGDVVSWRLGGSLPHIGIVGPHKDSKTQNPLIIHNIGQGPREEDVLFKYPMQGHYRYTPGGTNESQPSTE